MTAGSGSANAEQIHIMPEKAAQPPPEDLSRTRRNVRARPCVFPTRPPNWKIKDERGIPRAVTRVSRFAGAAIIPDFPRGNRGKPFLSRAIGAPNRGICSRTVRLESIYREISLLGTRYCQGAPDAKAGALFWTFWEKLTSILWLTRVSRCRIEQNVVGIVAKGSSRFNDPGFQVIESKDTTKGSAPAPKTDSAFRMKQPVFNCFCFYRMRRAYGNLLKVVEPEAFRILNFIYIRSSALASFTALSPRLASDRRGALTKRNSNY